MKTTLHVWVCGEYAGAYEFTTREEAEADMNRRRRDFGVLGCWYRLEEELSA